jgi:hypothetical protein
MNQRQVWLRVILAAAFFILLPSISLLGSRIKVPDNTPKKVHAKVTEVPGEPIHIGDTLQVSYVQHDEDNEYQVGYFNKNNELIWKGLGRYKQTELKVLVDEKATIPYIKRLKDVTIDPFDDDTPSYNLYLPKDYKIAAGVIHRGSGKTNIRVPTEMIYAKTNKKSGN